MFVKKLARSIKVSPEGGRAAVITFSNKARHLIKFSDHTSINSFETAVDKLKHTRGQTYINTALNLAHDEMFQEANGMRPNVPKILVVITDGRQTRKKDDPPVHFGLLAKLFTDQNIRVIVIGVGEEKDLGLADMRKLVKDESDLHIGKDFDVLLSDSFLKDINVCTGTV